MSQILHLGRILSELNFKETTNKDRDIFMTLRFDSGMKLMAWDLKHSKSFSPNEDSTVMMVFVAPDGSFIDAAKITSVFQARELVTSWGVIAEATTFKQAPDGKGAHFALFDSENDGYAIVASRHPGFDFGGTLYSVRSQYLKETAPETKGLAGRSENVVDSMRLLENQVQIDYDHWQENSPSM